MGTNTLPTSQTQTRGVRNLLYTGSLLAILIWGSSILIGTISHFQQINDLKHFGKSYDDRVYPDTLLPSSNKKPLDFSAVRDGVFRPSTKEVQWIQTPESIANDQGTYVVTEKENDDVKYVIRSIVDSSYEYILFNGSSFKFAGQIYDIDTLVASPDLEKAIITTNTTKNWRHSSTSLHWLLTVKDNRIEPISNIDDKIAVAAWAPTSSHVAYILDNNVYVLTLDDSVTQVTFDGNDNIFYGKPDWVYEEEVFSSDITLWWSPDGRRISFLKFNDTLVPEFTIPYYVQDHHEDYPEVVKIKYPKAGYANPVVDLLVYDLNDLKKDINVEVKSFTDTKIENRLITEVAWVSNDFVLVKTTNRGSDLLEVHLISADTNESTLVRSHTATDSWFEVGEGVYYIPKNESAGRVNDGYIDTIVVDGYNHLAYFSPPTTSDPVLLTKGQWEVIGGVKSFDHVNNFAYFQSTAKSSTERHLYKINLLEATTKETLPVVHNITDDSQPGWYRASFSSGSKYLISLKSGPDVPEEKLVDLHSLETIKVLESNDNVVKSLSSYDVPKKNYTVINLGTDENGEEILANAVEILPLNFNPSKKYPVLFFVYGGPGSQLVTKEFSVGFSEVVAAELNSIVVTVDGRGTGYNNMNKSGAKFKFIVRDRLGHYEPLDQIAAAKLWSKKLYVDSERIAIWGWSYGGFLTLKTLETDSIEHVFKYGVAVAPVTKWKLYDSIYTERYLREPQANPSGYETASIHELGNFENINRFLIMHGTGDDNVHFQNSLRLLDEFNLKGVENYDFMAFPDSDHSIRYHNGNTVVYDRILGWIKKAFNNEFK